MTKEEAILAMKQGKSVKHRFFTSNEFMFMPNPKRNEYKFEDGTICSASSFWWLRSNEKWNNDWRICNSSYF